MMTDDSRSMLIIGSLLTIIMMKMRCFLIGFHSSKKERTVHICIPVSTGSDACGFRYGRFAAGH